MYSTKVYWLAFSGMNWDQKLMNFHKYIIIWIEKINEIDE